MRAVILSLFVLACSAYFGSYAALVRPTAWESPQYPGQVEEDYPRAEQAGGAAGQVCRRVYAPANWIDRQLRPRDRAPVPLVY